MSYKEEDKEVVSEYFKKSDGNIIDALTLNKELKINIWDAVEILQDLCKEGKIGVVKDEM